MTRALLFYGHVASNWGDLAINAGALELMRRADIDVEKSTAVLLGPSDQFRRQASFTLKGMGLTNIPADGTIRGGREEIELLVDFIAHPQRFAETLDMSSYDFVILNAGEHLFDSETGENVVDLIWRILPAVAAQTVGVPTVLLPSTIGPFRTTFGTEVERFVHSGLGAAALRDSESLRLAQTSLSASSRQLPVLLDPGFFAPGLRGSTADETADPVLGIVLRPEDVGIRPGSRRSAFVQQKFRDTEFRSSQAHGLFAAVARDHLESGGRVRIIVQTRADRDISRALAEHLFDAVDPGRVEFADPDGFHSFVDELGRLDALVTSRFHSVILALSQAVPSVGVYSETHGHKMPGLFKSLRFPELAVRLDDRSIPTVSADVATSLVSARDSIDTMHNRIRANRSVARRWLTEVLEGFRTSEPPTFDTAALRIEALERLCREGLARAEKNSLTDVLRAVRETREPVTESDIVEN